MLAGPYHHKDIDEKTTGDAPLLIIRFAFFTAARTPWLRGGGLTAVCFGPTGTFFAAAAASILRGAMPPVDLRAVCLVRAIPHTPSFLSPFTFLRILQG